MRPTLEVADIFRYHGEAFRRSHGAHLSRVERRVMAAIEACRTPVLGGHVEQCGDCGLVRIPTQGGQVFRFDRGHHSDLMAATIPI